jgi:hypothetical protein
MNNLQCFIYCWKSEHIQEWKKFHFYKVGGQRKENKSLRALTALIIMMSHINEIPSQLTSWT